MSHNSVAKHTETDTHKAILVIGQVPSSTNFSHTILNFQSFSLSLSLSPYSQIAWQWYCSGIRMARINKEWQVWHNSERWFVSDSMANRTIVLSVPKLDISVWQDISSCRCSYWLCLCQQHQQCSSVLTFTIWLTINYINTWVEQYVWSLALFWL